MDDDRLHGLRQLTEYAAGLEQVADSMRPPALQPVERGDQAGAFLVRLGEDGVPDRIRVADDWSRRISPQDIGRALLEAYGVAAGAYLQAWAEHLQSSEWQERMLRQTADRSQDLDGQGPAGGDSPPPGLETVAEAALAALQSADAVPVDARPREASGVNASRRAVIVLSRGRMTACDVDAQWARRQSPRSLANALARALHRAREEFHREREEQEASRDAQVKQSQALFNDALQILKNPQRFSGT